MRQEHIGQKRDHPGRAENLLRDDRVVIERWEDEVEHKSDWELLEPQKVPRRLETDPHDAWVREHVGLHLREHYDDKIGRVYTSLRDVFCAEHYL